MAANKFRKILPAHAVKALEQYLQQVSAFVTYVEAIKNNFELPEQVSKTLNQQIKELRSYDE